MKKFLILFMTLLMGLSASADFVEVDTNVNMKNFWDKNGKEQQKIDEVSGRILNANQIDKRIVVKYNKTNIVNACSWVFKKY